MQEENKILFLLKKIWPTIYWAINSILYFVITMLKSIVSSSIKQIKDN